MFKCNILIFNFWTLLAKSTNQPAPQTNQQGTNQPQNRHNKAQKAVSRVFV